MAGETVRAAYVLEYGEDVIEMHAGAVKAGQRVLLVDDLIATGGTMGAGIKLMHQVGPLSVQRLIVAPSALLAVVGRLCCTALSDSLVFKMRSSAS